jgi:hypothetical protein
VSCVEVRENLGELALGLLPPDEARQVKRHLESCPGCEKEWAELREGVASVALSLPVAEPSGDLEHRVVDGVRAAAGKGRRRPVMRRGARLTAVAALAAALVAGGALQWGFAQRHHAESLRSKIDRVLQEQTNLASLVAVLQNEFRGNGTLYQASLFPGAGHQAAGTALIFSAPKSSGFVLVHVESALDPKAAPYTVGLVGAGGRRLEVGTLAKTNNGDYVLYTPNIPQDLVHSDSVELSHVVTLTVVDRFGTPVVNGTVHPYVETPPTP